MEREKMLDEIQKMELDQIMDLLHQFGCEYDVDTIVEKLSNTWNDLSVNDEIFNTFEIKEEVNGMSCDFVDEAIYEIMTRFAKFDFMHYGVFSNQVSELADLMMDEEGKVERLRELFQAFFKMCKKFKCNQFEGMIYQVNDGLDLYSVVVDYLDQCMEMGRMKDRKYYQYILDFVERFRKQFPVISPFLDFNLSCEQAQVLVALKNPKGEKMFLDLLKNHHDFTEAVFHYALAYIDDQPSKALRILRKYEKDIQKESESYELYQQVIADLQSEVSKS